MTAEDWREGALYDDRGERLVAHISYRLHREEALDGFEEVAGRFVLRKEACPLHTGVVQLIGPEGARWLARVLRISRPAGDGDLQIIEPLGVTGGDC
jgi:hypothetical protein